MANAKSNAGNPDCERVSSLEYQVRNWARRYGVSEDRLRDAVTETGPTVRNGNTKPAK